MVRVTWNQLPDSVRRNIAAHYVPLVRDNRLKSAVAGIVNDYCTTFEKNRSLDGFTTMVFTEEQWMVFLLKWS